MALHAHAPIPEYGKWEEAEEYTQYFDKVRDRRASNNVSDHNQKATAKTLSPSVNAPPRTTGSNPETKVKDARPVRKEGGHLHRPAYAGYEGTIRKPMKLPQERNVDRGDYNDNQNASSRMNGKSDQHKPSGRNMINSETRVLPERVKVKRKNTGRGYAPLDGDVIVPPVPLGNLAVDENYTELFQVIAEKTPSRTPLAPSLHKNQSEDGKNKGHGIWQWFSGCFGSK